MGFWDFWRQSDVQGKSTEIASKRISIDSLKELGVSHKRLKTAKVGPTQARGTPKRYDRLAEEGYRQNVIVYRAINLVATAAGSIPIRLRKKGTLLDSHPALELLANPNPSASAGSLLSCLTGYYLIAGNAYVLRVGPSFGPPQELWPIRPDTIKIKEGEHGLPLYFEQSIGDKKQRFEAETVLHWRSFNPLSDWYGQAPLEAAALAVDQHNEGARWNLALIQNGGTPSGVLTQEAEAEPLTDQQIDQLRSQITERYSGSRNAGRPLLLEGGLKWHETGRSPKDLDWLGGMTLSSREIALAFGVPPQLLGIPDSQTFANYAEARQSLWEDTVIPLVSELLDSLNSWLLPAFGDDLVFTMQLDQIPALEAKRSAKFERLSAADFMTTNEKRAAVGLPPLDAGDDLVEMD